MSGRVKRCAGHRVDSCRYKAVYADLHVFLCDIEIRDSSPTACAETETGGFNALLQQACESGANAKSCEDPKDRHDDCQWQALGRHQRVKQHDVDDDRSEQSQREWHEAID